MPKAELLNGGETLGVGLGLGLRLKGEKGVKGLNNPLEQRISQTSNCSRALSGA